VLKAASWALNLDRIATEGTTNFDASSHVTYSEEEPNELTSEQVPPFLVTLKDPFPQQYGMGFWGSPPGFGLHAATASAHRHREAVRQALADDRGNGAQLLGASSPRDMTSTGLAVTSGPRHA
jgi:hypothetical protein